LKCGAGEGWRRSAATDRVRNELFRRAKEEWNILKIIKRRKINCIDHSLRINCLVKHVIERMIKGRIEVKESRGRRRKQLLDDLKEKRVYWKLKDDTRFFYIHGSVHRESNSISVQQDATYSVHYISVGSCTCFGCLHPSSGARITVITASGID